MNGCEDKIASIELWLDGELSGAESESLRVHMAACAGCSEARGRLEKLQSTLTGVLLSEAQRVDSCPSGAPYSFVSMKSGRGIKMRWIGCAACSRRRGWLG